MSTPIYGDLIERVQSGPRMNTYVVTDTDVPLEAVETKVDAGMEAPQIVDRLRPWYRRLPSLAIVERMRTLRDAFCRRHRIGRFDDRGWGPWRRRRPADVSG